MLLTFLAAENCFASGIASMLDMFVVANRWHEHMSGKSEPLFTTEIVSPGGTPVISGGCMQLLPSRPVEGADATDFVLLPPFIPLPDCSTAGFAGIRDWIGKRYRDGVPVAAMCTGSFLLAETGLLDNKRATTNWQFAGKFKRYYPQVDLRIEEILTEDSGLICSGAATSIYNLGLMIIGRYGSAELAAACGKALLVDSSRSSQAPYFVRQQNKYHRDEEILKAQRYLEQNYPNICRIDEVAEHVHLSSRHFKRRFRQATGQSPIQYLQMVRIDAARQRLELSHDTVEQITAGVGYEDCSTFRRLFKNTTTLSPREYRDKFLRM